MSEQACPYCHISRDWLLPNSPCCRARQDVEAARKEAAHWEQQRDCAAEEVEGWIALANQRQAEVERLHKVMDWCTKELSGTMEYGAVLGALRDREIDPLDQAGPLG